MVLARRFVVAQAWRLPGRAAPAALVANRSDISIKGQMLRGLQAEAAQTFGRNNTANGKADLYENNLYLPYSESELVDLLVQVKKIVPPWVRIMRIQREINSDLIVGGPKVSNLRQLLKRKLYDLGIICQCIRCREAGLKTECQEIEPELRRIDYKSSNGLETFLSVEDLRKRLLFGFLRLRKLYNPHRKELQDNGKSCAVVRELHVYGQMIDVGKKDFKAYQHKGIGSQLLKTAERIVENEYGLSKISIISSIGTREYYRKFDYHLEGPYMSKRL